MTTNEREAFEKWWDNSCWNMPNTKDATWEAWQARAALDQRLEVTDEMVSHAAKAYCKAIKSSGPHEHQLQGIRAVLQSIAQPVKVPDEAVLAACRRYQERIDAVCHHHDPCEAMEDAERLALTVFRDAMLSTSPQPQQAVPDGCRLAEMLRTCLNIYAEGVRPEGGLDRWENYMQKVRDTNVAARKLLAEYESAAPAYNDMKDWS